MAFRYMPRFYWFPVSKNYPMPSCYTYSMVDNLFRLLFFTINILLALCKI